MFYLLIFVALVLAAAEFAAAWSNRTAYRGNQAPPTWKRFYRWRWLAGLPFAALSVFVSYPLAFGAESYRVIGFPLMAAAFDEAGRDYVGPFTGVFMFINAVLWYFLPSLLLFGWAFILGRRPGRGA
ncbi:MAG: hypothetical protein AB1896_05215 [Thermodesulfobacteriota bacterium]